MARAMFLRKGAPAIHKVGDLSRDVLDAELIWVDDETPTRYIGRFAEGFGFFGIQFAKEDCRPATDEEVELCFRGFMDTIKFTKDPT